MPRTNLLTIAALTLIATAAHAQDVPARNGNVWDSRDHQPTAGGVRGQERAAGVAPSDQRQKSLDQSVEQLDRTVQQQAKQPTAAGQ